MKNNYLLTFREVMSALISTPRGQYNPELFASNIGKYNQNNKISVDFVLACEYFYDWSSQEEDVYQYGFAQFPFFEWNQDDNQYAMTKYGAQITDAVFREYADSYVTSAEKNTQEDITDASIEVLDSFMTILNETYKRYSTILDIYANNTAKLLDKVQSIEEVTLEGSDSREGSTTSNSSTTNVNRFKDTPQNAVNVDNDDGYNSDVNVSTGSGEDTSSSEDSGTHSERQTRTHNDDRDTLMKRIAEIQESYMMVLRKWVREFSELFWEEI